MTRRALIIGIDEYDDPAIPNLSACIADAKLMREVLAGHENGSPNFHCRIQTSPGPNPPLARAHLRQLWNELLGDFDGDLAFYFSGHGSLANTGGYLVTQDGQVNDPGLPMDDLVSLANKSKARSVLLILDCCFSGSLGNPGILQPTTQSQTFLREGVTVLAASRPTEPSVEAGGQGVFTELVVSALRGGAANIRGQVSAASIYGYVEAALGPWDQRPLYKSYANRLDPVRLCEPQVPDALLRELPTYFPTPEYEYRLDMSYEETNGAAKPGNVAIFKKFKRY